MPELVALAAIQGVRGVRARQLYDVGLRTVKDVAESSADALTTVFARGALKPPCKVAYTLNVLPAMTGIPRELSWKLILLICMPSYVKSLKQSFCKNNSSHDPSGR